MNSQFHDRKRYRSALHSGIALALVAGIFQGQVYAQCPDMSAPHVEPGNSFCQGGVIYPAAAIGYNGGELQWFLDSLLTQQVAIGNLCYPLEIPGTTAYYVVEVVDDTCISPFGTSLITMYPLPEVIISPPSPVLLDPSGPYVVLQSNLSSGNLWDGQWTSDSLIVAQAGTYVLSVTDENGCMNSDTANVIWQTTESTSAPVYGPFAPNAFTPDADFVNDVWCVEGLSGIPARLCVFNRWGRKLYDVTGHELCWTGGESYYPVTEQFLFVVEWMDNGLPRLVSGSFWLIR